MANSKRFLGFTLIELVVAVAILAIALGGLMSAIISSMALFRSTKERANVLQAIHEKIEELEDETTVLEDPDNNNVDTFLGMFAKYSNVINAGFDVEGLTPQDGDADGKVGRIILPITDGKLEESPNPLPESFAKRWGLPRDLNGNGTNTDDATDDYTLLPVTVRIEWKSPSNPNANMEMSVILTNRTPPAE